MKLAFILIAAFLLPLPAKATNFTASFSYDFTGAVVCTQAVNVNCYDHFEIGLLQTGGAFQTLIAVPLPPIPSGASGLVQGITSPVFSISGFGNATVAAIIVGHDANGNRGTSQPQAASAQVAIAPNPPTSLVLVAH